MAQSVHLNQVTKKSRLVSVTGIVIQANRRQNKDLKEGTVPIAQIISVKNARAWVSMDFK